MLMTEHSLCGQIESADSPCRINLYAEIHILWQCSRKNCLLGSTDKSRLDDAKLSSSLVSDENHLDTSFTMLQSLARAIVILLSALLRTPKPVWRGEAGLHRDDRSNGYVLGYRDCTNYKHHGLSSH